MSKHHNLFTNEVLNDIFCATREDSHQWCKQCVSTFDEFMGRGHLQGDPTARDAAIVSYICAHVETAFELGWREALAREAIPVIKQTRDRLRDHCDELIAQRDGKEPIRVRYLQPLVDAAAEKVQKCKISKKTTK